MTNTKDLKEFSELKSLYDHGKFYELISSDNGLFFLLLRSLARTENYTFLYKKAGLNLEKVAKKDLLSTLFTSTVSESLVKEAIEELYQTERAERKINEQKLLAELYKVRAFDWGGIHQNDINKHLINNYVKKIQSYDELVGKIEHEILYSLQGFLICSWYNNWTSIIIEDIFKDHPRVLATVGKIKQVDFFIDGIPFDLKVTYFPATFLEQQRVSQGLVASEVSELKKACKKFRIPIDTSRHPEDLILDMTTALTESSNPEVRTYYDEFVNRRKKIVLETINEPKTLLKWLYENQGVQRFDASNRLFLIVINQEALEESWKLKRDYQLLKTEIDNYLNSRVFTPEELLIKWSIEDKEYFSYSDAIFILK